MSAAVNDSPVTLHAMTCGRLRMPYPFLISGEEGVIEVPVPAFFIVHPRGTVLFDTGLPVGIRTDKERELLVAAPFFEVDFAPEADLAARLAAADHDIARVDYVVNSHLHFDHAGGNALVPNARLVVQKREWEAGTIPETIASNYFNPIHYDLGHDRLEIDGEHDLFGDGSVVCVPTYGHTPGHQSLKVRTADGDVALCGDACYLRRTLAELRLPDIVADRDAMLRSLELLRGLVQRGARLVFGHDDVQWSQLNHGPLAVLGANDVARAVPRS